jgi:hypothetical protein
MINTVIASEDGDRLYEVKNVTVEPDGNGGDIVFIWMGEEI